MSPLVLSPLILGGHSYIAQLGNDTKPCESKIDDIVMTCLNTGITRFDTTYRPERIALGASLARLGRRKEAKVIVWNFFHLFDDGGSTGGPSPYTDEHLEEILRDLQTDYLDDLVVHPVGDFRADLKQEQVVLGWKATDVVQRLGVWSPGLMKPPSDNCTIYDFAVEPHNLFTQESTAKIASYAKSGWSVYACSPFVRGWQMDKLTATAISKFGMDETTGRSRVADHLLRFSLFAPHVDCLIVAMRRPEWVRRNLSSVERGPLDESERRWLEALK